MEKEKKHGLMELVMKVTMLMERKMALVNSSGLMDQHTKETSKITILMAEVYTFGLTTDVMMGNG